MTDWQSALELFDITLNAQGLTTSEGWEIENGRRVKEAYTAVYKIIRAIARALAAADEVPVDDDYILKAILQFVDSFSGVELRLVAGSDVDAPQIYAITNPNGNPITLYNTPTPLLQTDIDADRDYALHTAENLVHEFGHILDFRTGGLMYLDEWFFMRKLFGNFIDCGTKPNGDDDLRSSLLRGFNVNEGWDFNLRQNKLGLAQFGDCYNPLDDQELCDDPTQTKKDELCQELEIERIADMFLFWVYSDDSAYAFTNDDRGEALRIFANGGSWSRGGTSLTTTGFLAWIVQAAE